MTSQELAKQVVKVLDDKKALNIEAIYIEKLTILADYFVIASANNTTHVKSLADEVEFKLKESGIEPARVEGYTNANWIVIDYHDVVVHIFYQEARDYYNLSKLWADGEKVDVDAWLKE